MTNFIAEEKIKISLLDRLRIDTITFLSHMDENIEYLIKFL